MKFRTCISALLLLPLSAFAQAPAGRVQPGTPAPSVTAPASNGAPALENVAPVSPDTVVLTIGAEKITKAQYEQLVAALPDQMRATATGPNKRQFVTQLAEMKALAQEARERKLDQTPENQAIMKLQADNLLASLLVRNLDNTLKVDDTAEHAYYDQHKTEFEEAKASHILIRFKGSKVPLRAGEKELTEEEALAKAQDLRKKILAGADMAALAKTESDDTGSGANGGSLGTFERGRMVAQFDNAVFTLPVGQLSEPVKTPFGYHLIKVESRETKPFEQVKPQLDHALKQDLVKHAIENVQSKATVTINDAYFGKAAPPTPQLRGAR